MLQEIKLLEKRSRQLDPTGGERKALGRQVDTYIQNFLDSLPRQKAYQQVDCSRISQLRVSEEGKPLEDLLEIIGAEVDAAGINATSGKHMGYIPGGSLWVSALGDLLAAVSNRYAGIFFSSPGGVIMENQLLKWLCQLAGFPPTAHGNLSSGGSIASLIALTTARDQHGIRGSAMERAVIYYSEQMHHCLKKAMHITGLDQAQHRIIPTDGAYQMVPEALQQQMETDLSAGLLPFLVIATAGTTDTGAIDPLEAIGQISKEQHCWYHIDAAYGGFFLLLETLRPSFAGIEMADSLVMDPHKGLFLPFGTGVVLIKDAQALLTSHAHQASYMIDSYGFDEINPSDCGPELTKHFRGLRMWLPLHLHGLAPFRACLREKRLLCQYFHQRIQELGFEVGPPPALSVALFRHPAGNSFNQRLVAAIHADGRYFMSSTRINGTIWIRCAVLNFRTHLEDIEGALQMITEVVSTLVGK